MINYTTNKVNTYFLHEKENKLENKEKVEDLKFQNTLEQKYKIITEIFNFLKYLLE